MRLTQSGGRLVVVDTPGVVWLLGLVFVASGTFVLAAAPTSAEWATFALWERAAVIAIGLAHLGGGLFFIRAHPSVRTELDLARGTGVHMIRRPAERRATVTRFPLTDVHDVSVLHEKDRDGDPVYGVGLLLTGGRELRMESFLRPGEAAAREHVSAIRRFAGLPALPAGEASLA